MAIKNEVRCSVCRLNVEPGTICYSSNCPGEHIHSAYCSSLRNAADTEISAELVLVRGLPGSGKSTLAAEQFPDHLHYEPDHLISDTRGRYRFDNQFFDEAKRFVHLLADFALARGESVVVSDVFPFLSEIEPYQELAEAHGASLRVIDCTEQFGNSHRVPVMVMERMRRQFEPWPGYAAIREILKRQAD